MRVEASRHAPVKGEIFIVLGIVFVVGLLVLPLPPFLLDLFLALSIGASLLTLLVALYAERKLDFSSFPTVLLILTLYRLALNVSSTRLILGSGEGGRVIEAFGEFVVGGNYVVGAVIFLILVAINFIVITKGAGRVAEVAARFTLDALPGRQMSIDGDLSAGLIDDDTARKRRDEVSREADFFGAMDGAAKFVRGDAIASLLITGINIIGGLFVGVVQRGLPLEQALSQYTILTVGDGLVSQIPALVISTAAGIMVTSSSGEGRIAGVIIRQVGREPMPMWIASGFLGSLAVIPGLPTLPFLALSGGAALAARYRVGQLRQEESVPEEVEQAEEGSEARESSPVHDLLQIDAVELEVSYSLIPLIDERQGGDLLSRIKLLRKQAAIEMGILVPPIRIRDDVRLESNVYVVKIRGTEVARGEVMPRMLLGIDTGAVIDEIEGEDTFDPSFGMPAKWISERTRVDAEAAGYLVVEPSTVLATHLMETLKENAADLLGRQDVQEMVDALRESYPVLVDEVVPNRVPLGVLHRVLQRLLQERVPIRDMVTVLETLADVSEQTKDPEVLTEYVRRALSNAIGETHMGPDGSIRAITIGPGLEAALMGVFSPRANRASSEILDPDSLTALLGNLDDLTRAYAEDGRPIPVITPPGLRVGVRKLIEPVLPHVPVISLAELPPQATLQSVATWEMPNAA